MSMNYTVIKKFNDSGQKKVYLVDCPQFGKCILKRGICRSEESLSRIQREIEILKSLNSPYFPKNYCFEVKSDGSFILFEEYINSSSLREKMGLFSNEIDAFILILRIVNAMKVVWERKIVHRDLKPENILIRTDTLEPVIIDFGIARIAEEVFTLS